MGPDRYVTPGDRAVWDRYALTLVSEGHKTVTLLARPRWATMAGTGAWRAVDGRNLVMALGLSYVLVAIVTVYVTANYGEPIPVVIVTFSFVAGSGLVLLAGGYHLTNVDISPQFYVDVFERSLAGVAVMLGLLAIYHVQPGVTPTDPERSIPILTGLSAVAGFAVGVFDARAKTKAHELAARNRELQRTRERLEASNERLEQFAHAVSHDLQEPLRMVSSYASLVERRYGEELDDEAIEYLEFAVDGAERMSEMIDGLLRYSRVDTQGDPFEPVDLEVVLETVRKDLEVRIEETDADLTVGPLPTVYGDGSQLRQLFQNLFANAIEYRGDADPQIDVEADRDGDEWAVSVSDDGIGIDPDDHERIFEVFQRLHTQEAHPGTGIGLALCDRIVDRHGGSIEVDSSPGAGSTFSVRLPADEPTSASRGEGASPGT